MGDLCGRFRQYVQRKLSDAVRLLDNPLEVQANLLAQKYMMVATMDGLNAALGESNDLTQNSPPETTDMTRQPSRSPALEPSSEMEKGAPDMIGVQLAPDPFSAGVMTGLQMVLTMLESQPSSRVGKWAPALRGLVTSMAKELQSDAPSPSLPVEELAPIRRVAPGGSAYPSSKSPFLPLEGSVPGIETMAQPAASIIQMDFSDAETAVGGGRRGWTTARGDLQFSDSTIDGAVGHVSNGNGHGGLPTSSDPSQPQGSLLKRPSIISVSSGSERSRLWVWMATCWHIIFISVALWQVGQKHLVSDSKLFDRLQASRPTSITLPRTLDVLPVRPQTHRDSAITSDRFSPIYFAESSLLALA